MGLPALLLRFVELLRRFWLGLVGWGRMQSVVEEWRLQRLERWNGTFRLSAGAASDLEGAEWAESVPGDCSEPSKPWREYIFAAAEWDYSS